MSFNTSIKTAFLFLSFYFSTVILPMNLPQNKVIEYKSIIPSNDKIEEKKSLLGDFFGSLPTEVLYYSFKKSTPAMRNGLHPTNTSFSTLFSWENAHTFMLCKELNAHPQDIQSLIIQCMHKPNKSENEKTFIESYRERFFSYQILGEPRFLVLEYTDAKPDLYMFNHTSRKKKNIHPLLEVCLARNTAMVEDYLRKVDYKIFNVKKGLSLDIFRTAIQILVQNNDASSLDLILNNNKIGKAYKQYAILPICSKLIQAGVVCASHKTIPHLICYYKRKDINAMSNGKEVYKEKDWITKMLEKNPACIDQHTEEGYIYDVIKLHYPILNILHEHNRPNFEASVCLLLNETMLKDLGITDHISAPTKKKSHKKCVIM